MPIFRNHWGSPSFLTVAMWTNEFKFERESIIVAHVVVGQDVSLPEMIFIIHEIVLEWSRVFAPGYGYN